MQPLPEDPPVNRRVLSKLVGDGLVVLGSCVRWACLEYAVCCLLSHVAGTLASLPNARLCLQVVGQAIVTSPQSEDFDLFYLESANDSCRLGQDHAAAVYCAKF